MAPRSTEGEALRLPSPWAAVGRGTAAGRALFALYNGFAQARNRGNQYSSTNKIKILKHMAEHGPVEFPAQKPPPPKKPQVKVPHFYPKNAFMEYYKSLCPVELMRGRRKASEILEQLREDAAVVEVPPQPKGPLLDAKEKSRLQEVFYWANRDLGPDPPPDEKPAPKPPKRGSLQEKEMLMKAISKEVEDREAFLTEMEAYGKADKYRPQIAAEIEDRMNQLFLLHDQLSMAELEGVEQQCPLATRAVHSHDCNHITSTSINLPASEREHEQEKSSEMASSCCDHRISASSPDPSSRSDCHQSPSDSSPRDIISSDSPNAISETTTNRTTVPQNAMSHTKHLTIKVPRSLSSTYSSHNCNSASTRMCSPSPIASNNYNGGSSATSPTSLNGVDNIGSDVNELASPTPSSTSWPTSSITN